MTIPAAVSEPSDAVVEDGSTRRSLDWLNFFIADVRDGLGPYLAIFLLTEQRWDEAQIGLVMTLGALAGILVQAPAGALIDASPAKRGLLAGAALLVTLASVVVPWVSSFAAVAASQIASGVAASIFQPGIAALTLGMLGPRLFAARTGRNEAFNHAGNATAAVIAGAASYAFGPQIVFYLMAVMAVLSIVCLFMMPTAGMDHDRARGLDGASVPGQMPARGASPSGLSVLLGSKPLLLFAAAVVLFHFANAAMLPLVGQKLALGNRELGTTLMSVCIVAAQVVMVPVAMLVGSRADAIGHKPLFLAGLVVLALRGLLYPVSDNAYWLVGVQLLDGVGAGIFGALFPVIVNDLTRNTGHFNLALGAISAALGLGAAISTAVAGAIVVHFGYSAAFVFLGLVAAAAAVVWFALMPDIRQSAT